MYHEKLKAYEEAMDLAVRLCGQIEQLAPNRTLRDQVYRAATSIPLNLAEGLARVTPRDKSHHLTIARGSTAECGAIVDFLHKSRRINESTHADLKRQCNLVSKLIHGTVRSINARTGNR